MDFDFAKLNFDDAIQYFRAKTNIPTERWDELWEAEQDLAFTVAGIAAADLLADMRAAVDRAIAEGQGREAFAAAFDDMINRYGWNPKGGRDWRLNTIYQTNLNTAYAAGRYQQQTQPETLKSRPYWQWVHGDSRVPRPLHRALHLKVFRADDPFWQTMYPPCGFGCRCQVVTLSQADLDRDGLTQETAPETLLANGKSIPVRPDPGWSHTPGATPADQKERILTDALNRLSPTLRELLEP